MLNEVGEVIGVLTVAAHSEGGAHAVKGDVLAPLLSSAGFGLKT